MVKVALLSHDSQGMNDGGNGTLNSKANACILLERSNLPPVMI